MVFLFSSVFPFAYINFGLFATFLLLFISMNCLFFWHVFQRVQHLVAGVYHHHQLTEEDRHLAGAVYHLVATAGLLHPTSVVVMWIHHPMLRGIVHFLILLHTFQAMLQENYIDNRSQVTCANPPIVIFVAVFQKYWAQCVKNI